MTGVYWIELPTHRDARGHLIALDRLHGLPFEVQRIFYLLECPPAAVRGMHTLSADELLVAVKGSVGIDCKNGREYASFALERPDRALHVRAGVWVRLRDFSPDAVVLVASPVRYAEVIRFDKHPRQRVA